MHVWQLSWSFSNLKHCEYLGMRFFGMCKSKQHVRGESRSAVTSKMKRFVIIVNGFQPITIITKRSILDVAAALDPRLHVVFVVENLVKFNSLRRKWFDWIFHVFYFILNFFLSISWRSPLSYRNQSIDLQSNSMDWFLYDNGLRHEIVKFAITSDKY